MQEMVLVSNAIGFVFLIGFTHTTGELYVALSYCIESPLVTGMLLLQSVSAFLGVQCYLTLIKKEGGALAVAVTTIRKAFTIVLSFLSFGTAFVGLHALGGAAVLAGIMLNTHSKQQQQQPPQQPQPQQRARSAKAR